MLQLMRWPSPMKKLVICPKSTALPCEKSIVNLEKNGKKHEQWQMSHVLFVSHFLFMDLHKNICSSFNHYRRTMQMIHFLVFSRIERKTAQY